jgi:hypothetical protein
VIKEATDLKAPLMPPPGGWQPGANSQEKEIGNHENQNERQGRDHQWGYSYRGLKRGNQYLVSKKGKTTVKIKTNVNAGGILLNHNQTAARALKDKTNLKAGVDGSGDGGSQVRHNRTVARGLKVKTGIKAGPPDPPIIRG